MARPAHDERMSAEAFDALAKLTGLHSDSAGRKAACAIELGSPLFSRDTDFDRVIGLVRIGFKEAP